MNDDGTISTVHRQNIDHNGETKIYNPNYPNYPPNFDRNIRKVKDYDTLKQKHKDANDEFDNYLKGNYKYNKGKGWTLKRK